MKTMKWLLLREFWENKGSLVWAPVAIATLLGLLAMAAIFFGRHVQFDDAGQAMSIGTVTIEGTMRSRIAEATYACDMVSAIRERIAPSMVMVPTDIAWPASLNCT